MWPLENLNSLAFLVFYFWWTASHCVALKALYVSSHPLDNSMVEGLLLVFCTDKETEAEE